MKKIILLLFCIVSLCSYSQVYNYKSYEFAARKTDFYGNWLPWTDWIKSDCNIVLDAYTDVLTIYSRQRQVYKILRHLGNKRDMDGSYIIEWYARDSEYLNLKLSMRIQENGVLQLYIEYSDLKFVYNIIKQSGTTFP